jgi:5-formaminoimidazole-4-carboxamide-1-beta-D-ribofuranosyl 5'-monophosphate synthetase
MFELGRKAAEILIRNVESLETLPIENVVLNAELVVRESTRALVTNAAVQSLESYKPLFQPSLQGNVK